MRIGLRGGQTKVPAMNGLESSAKAFANCSIQNLILTNLLQVHFVSLTCQRRHEQGFVLTFRVSAGKDEST
jgi:hypothetical protein